MTGDLGPSGLDGTWVATLTAYAPSGRVDTGASAAHAEWVVAAGVEGVLVGGTNGEGPLLSTAEHLALLDAVLATGARTMATCTAGNLPDAQRFLAECADRPLAGVVVLPPHYYQPLEPADLERWFEELVPTAGHRVVAYHVPKYAVAVPASVVAALPVWGAKDSGSDLAYTREVLAAGKGSLIGTEQDLLAALETRADGLVSALANIAPELVCRAWVDHPAADASAGRDAACHALGQLRTDIKRHPSISTLKALATARHGIDLGPVRAPLARMVGPVDELSTGLERALMSARDDPASAVPAGAGTPTTGGER